MQVVASHPHVMMGSWTNIRSTELDGTFDGRCYDYGEMLDELRCHTSESVELARLEAVAEQRWWHLRELAALRVLDERGKVDDSQAGKDGTRTRDVRRKRATARNLAQQPNLAKAAANGKLSEEQLNHASDLAGNDPERRRGVGEQRAGLVTRGPREEGAGTAHAQCRGWGGATRGAGAEVLVATRPRHARRPVLVARHRRCGVRVRASTR